MSAPVFVKCLPVAERWRLDAEADGLARLARAGAIRVPRLLGQGATATEAFLEIEWLELRPADGASDARMGQALARLHATTGATYGLERDNAIGATPQPNAPADNWVEFWRTRRLGFQLDLAETNGYGGRLQDRGRRLLDAFPAFFVDYRPQPSLLHGDLWGGNRAMLADGTPVVYDPAVYYGDCEADIAMTQLFGGFGPRFYSAYEEAWPPVDGRATRRDLYNLYHVLNHLNLFGGGYRAQAETMIDRLLAEL
ncbi:MAG TPA: fructosamine kinase family protein [Steroidobacteraceae bacterium]|nr:fructosamine kinase family protein [Steroidobacteraceae bacterium]